MENDEYPMNPIGQHFVCLPCLDCEGEDGVLRGEGATASDVGGWCCWCGDWFDADENWIYRLPAVPRGDRCNYVHEVAKP